MTKAPKIEVRRDMSLKEVKDALRVASVLMDEEMSHHSASDLVVIRRLIVEAWIAGSNDARLSRAQ